MTAEQIMSAQLKAEGYPQCASCGIQLGYLWKELVVNRWPCCGDGACRRTVRLWAPPAG